MRDLKDLPKAHLHLHLEGGMRRSTLEELSAHYGMEMPQIRGYGSFTAFSDMYEGACHVMQTSDDLKRLAFETVEDGLLAGAVYIEPSFGRGEMQTTTIINEWVTWATDARKLRSGTVFTYVECLKALDAFATPKQFPELTLVDMERFLRRPRGRGCTEASAATLGKEITIMRSLWDWMHARGFTQTNPARLLVSPRLNNEKPDPIRDGDWIKLWSSDLRDEERVAFGLSYFCGMRRADVCRLKVGDFRNVPEPHIHQAELKGGKRMDVPWGRLVSLYADRRPDLLPTPRTFVRALQGLLQAPQERPLLRRWAYTDFVVPEVYGRHMERAAAKVGITAHLHQLRHAHATNLLAMGISLERTSRLMGHSNIQTTMRYVSTGQNPLIGIQEINIDMEMPQAYVGEVVKVRRYS